MKDMRDGVYLKIIGYLCGIWKRGVFKMMRDLCVIKRRALQGDGRLM